MPEMTSALQCAAHPRVSRDIALASPQAAVYGALCGHVAKVLPVCRGWEDTAWAFVRCWLEAAVDDALGESVIA